LHDAGAAVKRALPAIGSVLAWLVEAAGAGVAGVAIGALAIPAMTYIVSPPWRWLRARLRRGDAAER
jgi:hypothetical protein